MRRAGAVGTLRLNRKGVPAEIKNEKLKQKGDSKIMAIPNEITLVKIFDRKVVTLISSVYNGNLTNSGKVNRETQEAILKPKLMLMYKKYRKRKRERKRV